MEDKCKGKRILLPVVLIPVSCLHMLFRIVPCVQDFMTRVCMILEPVYQMKLFFSFPSVQPLMAFHFFFCSFLLHHLSVRLVCLSVLATFCPLGAVFFVFVLRVSFAFSVPCLTCDCFRSASVSSFSFPFLSLLFAQCFCLPFLLSVCILTFFNVASLPI